MNDRRFLRSAIIPVLAVAALAACAPKPGPPPGSPLRFGLVADAHYAEIEDLGIRRYRASSGKLQAVVERFNAENLDFILELGDFKDMDPEPSEARTLDYLRTIEGVLAGFRGPRYHALGNHDLDSISKSQFLEIAENTGIPRSRSYFSFEAKGVRIFVLDACFKSDGSPYDRGNFEWADSNIPPEELRWLEEELAASSKPAIIFLHQQLDGAGDYFVRNAGDVRSVLEDSGKVLAVFQGHRHEGQYHRLNGIPYVTLKALVDGPAGDPAACAVVQVDAGLDLDVRGYGKAVSLALPRFLSDVRPLPVETAADRDARLDWWRDTRFGVFIHWGLYAIPAGEWNGRTDYGEWIRNNARIPIDVYDRFVLEFNPVKFDARAWVRAAKDAGAGYIVITSKHHDGFAIFDSAVSDFDVMSAPFGRDILAELAAACRKEGIQLCFYHSIMDWHHPDYLPRRPWEEENRPAAGAVFDRYVDFMKIQLRELLTKYGDLGVLWFDGEWEPTWTEDRGRDLERFVRSLQPRILVNNRVGATRSGMEGFSAEASAAGDFGTPEQQIPATGLPGVDWEACMTMNDNWGYNRADDRWKSPRTLIRMLADTASKGGNLLLNVGPTAEGLFPEESLERLAAVGRWMRTNAESIRGTRAGPFTSLPWGRATQKTVDGGTRLYLHVFEWPADGTLAIPGLLNEPRKAFLLADASRAALAFERREDALILRLPVPAPDENDSVVVLDLTERPDVGDPPRIEAETDIFTEELFVAVKSDRENVRIRYTLDGSAPTSASALVDGPVPIRETAVLSARCFRGDRPVSGTAAAAFSKVAPRPPVRPGPVVPGLRYSAYEGEWDVLPDFGSLKPAASGLTSGFELGLRKAKEKSGIEFTGFIRVPKDGVYAFFTSSDDGSRLWIGETLVVDNDGLHGLREARGLIALAGGWHPLRLGFFNKTGGEGLEVFYQGPGLPKQAIPQAALFRR